MRVLAALVLGMIPLLVPAVPGDAALGPCSPGVVLSEPFGAGFVPGCVHVDPGSVVTWVNADTFTHAPASADADHACFSVRRDTGSALSPGEAYEVGFAWDGTVLTATTVAGTTTCSASGPTTYTVVEGEARVPFVCQDHEDVVGFVLVRPA